MKIEKLNENKIRITLDINDLKEKNIDFHSFMSNSLDSQSLFLEMLAQAEEEVGFETKNHRIMIEALATSDGDFIITVTRALPDSEPIKRKKVKIQRKAQKLNTDIAIYEFKSFDDFCDFATSLDKIYISAFKKVFSSSKLYLYNSKYYLVLEKLNVNSDILKNFYSYIAEFSNALNNSKLFSKKLSEYGKVIIKRNPINVCKKHFDKVEQK